MLLFLDFARRKSTHLMIKCLSECLTVEWRSCRHRHTLFYHFIHFFENVKNLEAYFLTGIKTNIHVLMFLNKLKSTFTWTLPTLFLVVIFRTFNGCNRLVRVWGQKFNFENKAAYFLLMLFADQKMATISFFFLLSEHQMLSADAFLLPLLCKLNRFPHLFLHSFTLHKSSTGVRRSIFIWESQQSTHCFTSRLFFLLSLSTSHSRWITQCFSKSRPRLTLES